MNDKTFMLINIGLAAICLAAIGIACIDSPAKNPGVIIHAFDQNPAGSDDGNEWITLHNPSNETIDMGNGTLETAEGKTETMAEGVVLNPGAYYVFRPFDQWLANSDESIILKDSNGAVVDKTPVVSDTENDNRYWLQKESKWIFGVREFEKGKIRSGQVKNVVDGDTIDVAFGKFGIRRIRLVGVNTPETGEAGYAEAKEFVEASCLGEVVEVDVDDEKQYNQHYRVLAVVYVDGTNQNERLVREGYAEVMFIPPSEFDALGG